MMQSLCADQVPPPQIVPGPNGDLQIEWHCGDVDIEIHVISPNKVHAWRLTPDTGPGGEEIDLTNDFRPIAAWIDTITEPNGAVDFAAA